MNRKRSVFGAAALMFLAAFPWGPLFAWSPVHPGYLEARFARADVLYPESRTLDPEYRDIDRYLAAAENFHDLQFRKRIKVIVCGDWNDCLRFAAPFLMGQRPLAVTIATGTVVFVTPNAEGWPDIGGLLRHELSHAVLSQNHSLLNVWKMLKQPWVGEGVAGVVASQGVTAPGRHLVTLPEPEFLAGAKTEELWPAFTSHPRADYRFNYSAWTFFWDRQIARSGKAAFLKFEQECFADPSSCTNRFATIYGTNLRQAVDDFQAEVRSGRLS